jgi:hypothetical protein
MTIENVTATARIARDLRVPLRSGVVAHCGKRKGSNGEKAQPDCTGISTPQARLQSLGVQVDHLIQRLAPY